MTPIFVGVNEKFINLHHIALLEDESNEQGSIARITTSDGTEIELIGDDADVIFERVEMFAKATDELITKLLQGGPQQ